MAQEQPENEERPDRAMKKLYKLVELWPPGGKMKISGQVGPSQSSWKGLRDCFAVWERWNYLQYPSKAFTTTGVVFLPCSLMEVPLCLLIMLHKIHVLKVLIMNQGTEILTKIHSRTLGRKKKRRGRR